MSRPTGTSPYFRVWGVGPSRVAAPPPEEKPPSAASVAEWEAAADDEDMPDRYRVLAALALLYTRHRNRYVRAIEVATLLDWDERRARAGLAAAVEAGWTNGMGG